MTIRDIPMLLRDQAQLQSLGQAHLDRLAGCAQLRVIDAGVTLAREDDPADEFYVVRSGLLAVEAHGPASHVVVDTVGPGEISGWSWIFPPHRWAFDVRAAERSHLVVFDGECMRGACERDHELGFALMRCFSGVLVERLTSATVRLLDLYEPGSS